ncbi:hypothetical protein M413DRAFT_264131 [Hebeloma cylindrosporum]|uniref:Uncharacterized protein n=1 Tax=Hebeloma cylindrosporum TaxID=76867 RepID=A0A0C3CSG3_HEBCY|nr:hypothetical protein M413DRAFT_264131 [Hebeloma cylindrosporum h7]
MTLLSVRRYCFHVREWEIASGPQVTCEVVPSESYRNSQCRHRISRHEIPFTSFQPTFSRAHSVIFVGCATGNFWLASEQRIHGATSN